MTVCEGSTVLLSSTVPSENEILIIKKQTNINKKILKLCFPFKMVLNVIVESVIDNLKPIVHKNKIMSGLQCFKTAYSVKGQCLRFKRQ